MKELNFEIGEVWHYDPHEIISKSRKASNTFAYEHEYKPLLEWKANFDSWLTNTKMEIETQAPNEKTQKRSLNEVEDTKIEEASSSKRAKLIEEELETTLIDRNLDWPGFQVYLEDPQHTALSTSIEVAIWGTLGSSSTICLKGEKEKMMEERNKKVREERLQ